jgi:hypothetical protein
MSLSRIQLNILQLLLVHTEVVAELVDDRELDLISNFGLGGANRFDVLLVEHDVIRPSREIEYTLLRHWYAVEEPQQEFLWARGWGLAGRKIFHQHGDIADTTAEFLRERVKHLLHDLGELFALHDLYPLDSCVPPSFINSTSPSISFSLFGNLISNDEQVRRKD